MIYPIVAYGHPVLRKKAKNIERDYPQLDKIIDNMFQTMYNSQGVGLAAPQVGMDIRLFVVDASPFAEDEALADGFKRIFINAEMIEETGTRWKFNEGCLSIPGIREDVERYPVLTLKYQDINFETHIEQFDGIRARIIQHEYDHLEGVLFTDRLSPLKKTMLKGRLNDIAKGKTDADYKMTFYNRK
jgi:peptide deformylase